jgi:hypothetical protein
MHFEIINRAGKDEKYGRGGGPPVGKTKAALQR